MSASQLIPVTVTVDTAILGAGDTASDGVITFPVSGHTVGVIRSLVIVDSDHNTAANIAGTVWFFNDSVTPATKNTAHSISDADALKSIGWIAIASTDVLLTALNSVATLRLTAPLPFDLVGEAIYGIYVVTATPTFTSGSVKMVLGVA
jgi:hypothetical protein